MTQTTKWDVCEHLDSEDRIALFLEAVFEDGDSRLLAAALAEVAKARGVNQAAQNDGISGN